MEQFRIKNVNGHEAHVQIDTQSLTKEQQIENAKKQAFAMFAFKSEDIISLEKVKFNLNGKLEVVPWEEE